MTLVFKDRVKFTTATTGTGAITVGSADAGFRTLAQAGYLEGDTFPYVIEEGTDWETGIGTAGSSAGSFTRSVRESTNSNNPISLGGTAKVRVDWLAQEAAESVWNQVVNESGASLSNWTGISGTWSSDGSVIKQTDTAASSRKVKYNTSIPLAAGILMQTDVQLKSSGTDRQAGIVMGFDGSTGAGAISVKLREGNNDIDVERDSQLVDRSIALTVNVDTWYTLRVLAFGNIVSVWVDGTFKGNVRTSATLVNIDFLGLTTYQAEAWFRNIKAWNLSLPL